MNINNLLEWFVYFLLLPSSWRYNLYILVWGLPGRNHRMILRSLKGSNLFRDTSKGVSGPRRVAPATVQVVICFGWETTELS